MWMQKFGHAVRGVKVAVRSEKCFVVHLFVTLVVVLAGFVSKISPTSWCLLTLCIVVVLAAEMFNTAIERVCREITRENNPQIRDALDMSAGAVLLVAMGAAIVGLVILGC